MKVVIVGKNPFYYREKDCYLAGHAVGFIYPFINFLLRRNHKVVMISPDKKGAVKKGYISLFPTPPKNKKFYHLFLEPKQLPKVPFTFASLDVEAAILEAKGLLGGIDFVASVYVFPWILPINDLKGKLGYKTVALLRGTDAVKGCSSESDYAKIYGAKKWKAISSVFKMALRESDLIFTTSDWLKRFAEAMDIPVDGITPTPPFEYAKHLRDFPAGDAQLKKKFLSNSSMKKQLGPIDPHKPWFIFLGRFHREKCVDVAISAFARSKNYKRSYLILGGNGPDSLYLRKLAKKLLLKNVKFCFVPPAIVPLFCKTAIAMIQPSLLPGGCLDARPHSCTNASYVGCPVIIPFVKGRHDFGGAHESLSSLNIEKLSYNPFLSRNNVVKAMAEKIDLLLKETELVSKIGEANKKWASGFDPEEEFSRLEKRLLKLR